MAGDPEGKKQRILIAVKQAGRLLQSEVAGAVGIPRTTAQRLLLELVRAGRISRDEITIAGRKGRGARGYVYWLDGDVPPPRKKPPTTIDRVLACVTGEMDSASIAECAGLSVSSTQGFLIKLARQGLLRRRKASNSRGVAGWRYLYRPGDGTSPADIALSVQEMDDAWWAPIRRAVERARPHWRKGELFPREKPCERGELHASNGKTVADWPQPDRTGA